MERCINVVCFNVPYPADYGGAIDVYYTLRALHDAGIDIILHSFLYDRPEAKELDGLCKEIHYYRRKRGMARQLSFLPYIVNSRKEKGLLRNLEKNDFPILFEGLHVCAYLNSRSLRDRIKLVRMCNIEHRYYFELFRAERNVAKRLFFLIESLRLKLYEPVLKHADVIYGISTSETHYLLTRFKGNRVVYMPCFHPNTEVSAQTGCGGYALYHANLSVAENERAALWIAEHIFSKLDIPAVIAGKRPSTFLRKQIGRFDNVSLYANLSEAEMEGMIRNAQLHVLVTFQPTGLKLKLLNTLYRGRHCVTNREMTEGSRLDALCHTADTAEGMLECCRKLSYMPFSEEDIARRKSVLYELYDNGKSVEAITAFLWPDFSGRKNESVFS